MIKLVQGIVGAAVAVATLVGVTTSAGPVTVATVTTARPATVAAPKAKPVTPRWGEDSLPPELYLWADQGAPRGRHGQLTPVGTVDGHPGCWAAVPTYRPDVPALLECPGPYAGNVATVAYREYS